MTKPTLEKLSRWWVHVAKAPLTYRHRANLLLPSPTPLTLSWRRLLGHPGRLLCQLRCHQGHMLCPAINPASRTGETFSTIALSTIRRNLRVFCPSRRKTKTPAMFAPGLQASLPCPDSPTLLWLLPWCCHWRSTDTALNQWCCHLLPSLSPVMSRCPLTVIEEHMNIARRKVKLKNHHSYDHIYVRHIQVMLFICTDFWVDCVS